MNSILKTRYINGKKRQSGSTLLVIIIVLVIIAVLGVAVYSLTYTATSNQAVAQRATRAYYLSESGVRIASSEYRAAVAAGTANSVLPALHNKTFKLQDNVSSFTLSVYPYWLYAKDAYSAGTNSIMLYLPGALPKRDNTDTAIVFPTGFADTLYLRIKDARSATWAGSTFVPYSSAAAGTFAAGYGTPVSFNLAETFSSDIAAGDEFYIGYLVTQNSTHAGNDLSIFMADTNMPYMFPPQQGTVIVVKSTIAYYKYDLRIVDSTVSPVKVTLTNIKNLDGTSAAPNILIGNQVYAGKSVGFRSTSTYGGE